MVGRKPCVRRITRELPLVKSAQAAIRAEPQIASAILADRTNGLTIESFAGGEPRQLAVGQPAQCSIGSHPQIGAAVFIQHPQPPFVNPSFQS